MANPVSDAVLGSRFWLKTDFSMAVQPVAEPGANQPDLSKVKHDSKILSFADAGGDTMAKSAIGKAELFAASHTLTDDEIEQERARAVNGTGELLGEDNKGAFVNEAAADLAEVLPGVSADERQRLCDTALTKLMATGEFAARARIPLEELGEGAVDRRLGADGLASLKNAVLGLAKMLGEGKVSEKAVVFLADGNFYDASNRADLLRLVSASANKVRQLFIGRERMEALVRQCEESLVNAGLPHEQWEDVEAKIDQLRQRMEAAASARAAVTKCIKTDYELTDSTGGVKSDSSFQKKQIDKIRNSLRAFRYDLDLMRGTGMGVSEWIRRHADNFFSDKVAGRMTREAYNAAVAADNAFNELLSEIRGDIGVHADVEPAEANRGPFVGAGVDDLTDGSMMSVADSARAATYISHLTNDRIRYHYSGIESRREAAEKEVRDALGDIAENGGRRSVTFRAGLDFVMGLDLGFVDTKLKAGGAIDIETEVKVSNGNGTVEVTYYYGGNGHAGLSTQFGVDPKDKNATDAARTGFGLKAGADVNLNVHGKTTKTYANFDEFVRATGRYNVLVNPQMNDMVYRVGKAAICGVGKLFLAGATFTGMRIRRSRMDQLAYSAALRDRNVFGALSGVVLKKRNVAVVGQRSALLVGGGVKAGAEGGFYESEKGKVGSNLSFSGSLGYAYSREFRVRGSSYSSFARSFEHCSAAFLANRFATEVADQQHVLGANDAWLDEMRALVDSAPEGGAAAINEAIGTLLDKLTALEDSAVGKHSDDKDFWNRFASRARVLAVATALLAKRAEAIDAAAQGAAEAKAVARNAVEYILPRLENPVVKVPSSIYRKKFFDKSSLTDPAVSTHSFHLNLSAKLLEKSSMSVLGKGKEKVVGEISKLGDGSLVNAGVEIAGNLIETGGETVIDTGRDMAVFLNNDLQVKVTRKNFVGPDSDPRPWFKGHATTLDVRVNGNITLGAIINAIVYARVKASGGLTDEELEKQNILRAFLDTMKYTAKSAIEETAVDSLLPLMDLTLGELSKKYGVFGDVLDAFHYFDEVMDAEHASDDESYKLLRFEYGNDGRFQGFSLHDDFDYTSKLTFKAAPAFDVSLEMQSKTSTAIYSVLTKPSKNTILGRAADYLKTGDPEAFKNFLSHNKLGVARIVRAGRANPAEPPAGDGYWEEDCRSMRELMDDLANKLAHLSGKGGKVADEAAELRRIYVAAAARMLDQPADMEVAEAIDIANDFFLVAVEIYNLAAVNP